MEWIRSRARRVRDIGRGLVWLILGGVALVTALTFWIDLLGFGGVVVVGGMTVVFLLAALLLPERLWTRLTTPTQVRERAEALDVIGHRLAAADALRDRLFREKPGEDEMAGLVNGWLVDALAEVDTHAPDYGTDFRMRRSVSAVGFAERRTLRPTSSRGSMSTARSCETSARRSAVAAIAV